jgi:MYXO-CTERM domain-containing protein
MLFAMARRLAGAAIGVAALLSSPGVRAEPVRTLDLTKDFGASPGSVSERQSVYDELTLAASLQGLANRSAPNFYLFYVTSAVKAGIETDQLWFDRLSDPAIGGGILDGRSVEALPDLDAAITTYASLISGLAVWDPNVPATVNAAFAAAGADDLLVVSYSSDPNSWYQKLSPKLATKVSLVSSSGGSVFLDNQGSANVFGTSRQTSQSAKADAYVWVLENYLKPGKLQPLELGFMLDGFWIQNPNDYKGNPQPTSQLQISNHDFLVARRGMPFDLSPWSDVAATDAPGQPPGTDPAILKEIVAAARDQAPPDVITVRGFFGWQFKYTTLEGLPAGHEPVAGEWKSVQVVSPWAVGLDADAPGVATLANASFHQHVPLPDVVPPQPRPTAEDLIGAGFLHGLAQNGGFEDGGAGWTLHTTNHAVYTDDAPGPPKAHSGLRYLECNTSAIGDDTQDNLYRDGPGASPGQQVTLRAFVRAPGAPVNGELVIWGLGGTTEQVVTKFTATQTWSEVRATLKVNDVGHTSTRGQLYLRSEGANLDVDDVAFYAGAPEKAAVEPANYVLWFVGDYDGASWLASFTPVVWDTPGRGVVPFAWDFSGHLASRFPPLFRHVIATRTERDFFIGADSGPGYGNPSLMNAERREIWANSGMRAQRVLDASSTWVLNPLDSIDATGLGAVTPFAGDGIVLIAPTSLSLPALVDHAPVISLGSAGGDDANAVESSVAGQLSAPTSPKFSAYRTVLKPTSALTTGSRQVVLNHPALAARFVDPYAFFYLLKHQLGAAIEKRASYLNVIVPSPEPGAPSTLSLTVRNDGWDTWKAGKFRLGAHLADTPPRVRTLPSQSGAYPIRVDLPSDVGPGKSVSLDVPLPALNLGSKKTVQLDMVEEGVAWFETLGDIPLQLSLEAKAASGVDAGSGGSAGSSGVPDGGGAVGGSGGTSSPSASPGGEDDSGCGCRTTGNPHSSFLGWLALASLAALLRRRGPCDGASRD